MTTKLWANESPITQGSHEGQVYALTTTPWGGSPTATSVVAYDLSATPVGRVVTTTVFPSGSTSVAGDVISWPKLKNLVKDHTYRIECYFTSGGNEYVALVDVKCPW